MDKEILLNKENLFENTLDNNNKKEFLLMDRLFNKTMIDYTKIFVNNSIYALGFGILLNTFRICKSKYFLTFLSSGIVGVLFINNPHNNFNQNYLNNWLLINKKENEELIDNIPHYFEVTGPFNFLEKN